MSREESSLRAPRVILLTPGGDRQDLPSEDRQEESILWPRDGVAHSEGQTTSQHLYRRHEIVEGEVYLFLEDSKALTDVPVDLLERLRVRE